MPEMGGGSLGEGGSVQSGMDGRTRRQGSSAVLTPSPVPRRWPHVFAATTAPGKRTLLIRMKCGAEIRQVVPGTAASRPTSYRGLPVSPGRAVRASQIVTLWRATIRVSHPLQQPCGCPIWSADANVARIGSAGVVIVVVVCCSYGAPAQHPTMMETAMMETAMTTTMM